jgi:DNA-binding Lrp family transcriptional regulator
LIELLNALQKNNDQSQTDLAKRFQLSDAQLGRNKKFLESGGYILSNKSIVNPKKFGLSTLAFVRFALHDNTMPRAGKTVEKILEFKNVQEVHHVFAPFDILVKLRCEEPEKVRDFQMFVTSEGNIKEYSTIIVSSTVLETTEISIENGDTLSITME